MSIDTTHHTDTTPDLRPGSGIQPAAEHSGVSRDTAPPVLSGTVHPAPSPFHHGIHPAYAPLPLHVNALNDFRNAPRPHPQLLEIIRYYHLWPALASAGFSACGWWANLEPNHVWLMIPFLGFGVASPLLSWLAHHMHGADADRHITHGLLAGGMIGLSGAAAVGAGFSGISAMTTALLAIVGTLGSVGWRQHRRQAAADAAIDYMESAAKAPMSPVPVCTLPVPTALPVG